jgi:hypothetical protein
MSRSPPKDPPRYDPDRHAGVTSPGVSPVVRDPGVTVGRFRVMQRTDGKAIVVDPSAAPAKGTLAVCDSVRAATVEAQRLALLRPGAWQQGD